MYSFERNAEAILNIKNAIPPSITGLNLIRSPVVVVAMPAINNIIGGGFISSLIQRKVAKKKEATVTIQRFLI
jgi:hypothetical protein